MKKIISLITIFALVFSLIPQVMYAADTSASAAGSGLVGDLSGDGSINSKDYALMKRYLLNYINSFPVSDTFWAADLNGDDAINSKDVSLMKRYLLGIIDIFPKTVTTPIPTITPSPTETPVPTGTPAPMNGVRIDFATNGDSTNMRCDFGVAATAVWHWADGTTAAAISGALVTKDGLGAGTHQNYLTVSNGSELTRFGVGNAGEGHLVSISGLQDCPNMTILYAYQESSLTSIGDTNTTKVREYHLMGTRLSVAQLDEVFANAALSGVQGGTLWADNSGTSESNADKETLKTRGWTLNIPAWTPQTPLPTTGEARINFTTTGDSTNMLCDFDVSATVVWHWADGTTTTTASGTSVTKNGLGAGTHQNYLTVSNSSALTRFGAGNAGEGHLVTISGLQNCPELKIVYTYLESSLTSIGDTSTTKVREYHLMGTQLSVAQIDEVFAAVVASGVQEGTLWADNSGTSASNTNKATLQSRGWTLNIPAWTPPPTPPAGDVRIDFTTAGDSTNMRCDFGVAAAVVWHWADGTTAAAISGTPVSKDGLGAGTHQNYLTVSNSSVLTRFGAGNAGEGHLVSISGLQNFSELNIVYAYLESSLTSIGDTSTTKVREYHLMGTRLTVAQLDGVFANAVASGVQGGTLWADNSGTSASNTDKETLKTRGWTLNIPAWTTQTPLPTTGEVRIDFTTTGDSTNMRCDFDASAEAVWHWADGTTTASASGTPVTKNGLGAGTHQNYLIVSNSSALTRFGAGNAGEGHIVSISGLQNCSNMAILYAYQESALSSIGDTGTAKVREYHLMGTRLSAAQLDGVFANAVASGVQGGTLWSDNSGTSLSNTDKATLQSRGWTLNIPAWTSQTPQPTSAIDVHITNNPEGIEDMITVSGVNSGYTVRVYLSQENEVPAYSAVVPDGQNTVTITVPQLGMAAGSIWVSASAPGVIDSNKVRADYQKEQQIPVTGGAITFVTEGSTFAPVIQVAGNAQITWTFADGTTSSSNTPVKDYGSSGTRAATLVVTPWSAVTRINIGYDAGDAGSSSIEFVPDQHVSSVYNLSLVAPYLRQWCSSYNQLTSLDFSNFTQLDTIECYLSQSLRSVNLTNTPELKRICFEDCDLLTLDVSQCPKLEDLRGAVNRYSTIGFGSVGGSIWHICVRDNQQITDQSLFQDMSRFPNIAELFIWNDNQAGSIRIPSSSRDKGIGFLASGNHYTSLNLQGALQLSNGIATVDFSNNLLANVDLTGCTQITNLNLRNNQLSTSEADKILAALDSLGRSRDNTPSWSELYVDISEGGNQEPSQAGYVSALSLSRKGWTVVAAGWTMLPSFPAETGEVKIDFTTTGDSTNMRCDFAVPATAVWHWSDGTTTTAVSNTSVTKSGLGDGTHQNYLTISNGSELKRFGAGNAGYGHLVSISGLQKCPELNIVYAYQESSLTSIGDTSTAKVDEYHLIGTQLSAAEMNRIFSDAAASGVLNGTIYGNNSGTAASDANKSTLRARGWSIY